MRALIFTLLVTLLGCDQAATQTEFEAERPAPADHLTFVATEGQAQRLIEYVDGQLRPWGPPLPADFATPTDPGRVWRHGDRAALLRRSADGLHAWHSDGTTWTPLNPEAPAFNIEPSPDLTRFWIDDRSGPDDAPLTRSKVLDLDGNVRFDTGTAEPWQTAPRLVRFAPSADWLVTFENETELVWHGPDGARRVLHRWPLVEGLHRRLLVYAAFDDSLILWDEHPNLRWVDLHGDPYPVEGFSSTSQVLPDRFQRTDSHLERIEAGRVVPVLPWSQLGLSDVYGYEPDAWAVVGSAGRIIWCDAAGQQRPFQPRPAEAQSFGIQQTHITVHGVRGGATPVVLNHVEHETIEGDVLHLIETTYQIWSPGSEPVVIARFADDSAAIHGPWLDPAGTGVLWLSEGTLHRHDLASGVQAPLAWPGTVFDERVRASHPESGPAG